MEQNKKVEYNEEISRLLGALENNNAVIKNSLWERYLDKPVSIEREEEIYGYFLTHSIVSTAVMANAGTSMLTEFLYDSPPSPFFPIDDYFLSSKGGRAIKSRLTAIENKLPEIIEEHRAKGEVFIGNLGSGPGRDVIDVFSSHYKKSSDIKAVHIDRDATALKRGKRMAVIKKVDHLIDFIGVNFIKYEPTKKFDIILLIGILCGLESDVCIRVLKSIRRLIKKDGTIIAGNVSKKMLKEDPFTYFLMEWVGNWKLVFKSEEELKQIFEKAGYKWRSCFTDSYGFHIMGIGTPKFYF